MLLYKKATRRVNLCTPTHLGDTPMYVSFSHRYSCLFLRGAQSRQSKLKSVIGNS